MSSSTEYDTDSSDRSSVSRTSSGRLSNKQKGLKSVQNQLEKARGVFKYLLDHPTTRTKLPTAIDLIADAKKRGEVMSFDDAKRKRSEMADEFNNILVMSQSMATRVIRLLLATDQAYAHSLLRHGAMNSKGARNSFTIAGETMSYRKACTDYAIYHQWVLAAITLITRLAGHRKFDPTKNTLLQYTGTNPVSFLGFSSETAFNGVDYFFNSYLIEKLYESNVDLFDPESKVSRKKLDFEQGSGEDRKTVQRTYVQVPAEYDDQLTELARRQKKKYNGKSAIFVSPTKKDSSMILALQDSSSWWVLNNTMMISMYLVNGYAEAGNRPFVRVKKSETDEDRYDAALRAAEDLQSGISSSSSERKVKKKKATTEANRKRRQAATVSPGKIPARQKQPPPPEEEEGVAEE